MKRTLFLIVGSVLCLHIAAAQAADSSCTAQSQAKKLAGAAKTSFMTKCEREAKEKCNTAATEKKLAGAAKNSFTQKCVKDAVGT